MPPEGLSDRDRLARNLKQAREAKGVSQVQAAKAVKKSRQTIVNWERIGGEFEPRAGEVEVLAALYGLTTQQLRYADLARGPIVIPPQTYAEAADRLGVGEENNRERKAPASDERPAAKKGGKGKRAS